jgi:hypothetical protein
MTTLRKAAEMALDALGKTMGVWGGTCAWHNDVEKAITTLKEALARPDQLEDCKKILIERTTSLTKANYRLEQLNKQEPAGVVVAAVEAISDAAMIKWTSDYRPKVGDLIYTTPAPIPEGWQLAIDHYERALKAGWPNGAKGEVFTHWNEARKALLTLSVGWPLDKAGSAIAYRVIKEVDPYAALKVAEADPNKEIAIRGHEATLGWHSGKYWQFDRPVEDYVIRDKPRKLKLYAYRYGGCKDIFYKTEETYFSNSWTREYEKDMEVEV